MRAYLLDTWDSKPLKKSRQHSNIGGPDLPIEELQKLGIYCSRSPTDDYDSYIQNIVREMEYKNFDQVSLDGRSMPEIEYEKKLDIFYEEHLHADEEARFIKAGRGFFDVRDLQDRWIRIEVEAGDLVILPAGIYHRFTTAVPEEKICAVRLFRQDPSWTPINRSGSDQAEKSEARRQYRQAVALAREQ